MDSYHIPVSLEGEGTAGDLLLHYYHIGRTGVHRDRMTAFISLTTVTTDDLVKNTAEQDAW